MSANRPRWEAEGRDWPNRAASRFVAVGQLHWHVQVMGEGPVLLLLHGTASATHSWRGLMPLLAQHFTVIAPDLPGHAFTTGRPAGGLAMPAMARAVGDLVAMLNVSPQIVLGHSAGAAIAIRAVLDGAVRPRAMIGMNSALLPFPGIAAKIFPGLARLLFVNPFAPHIFAGIARQQGETGKFLARSTGSAIDAAGADYYGRLFATPGHCAGAITMMADWDLETFARDLPSLNLPLLLVHGERDAAISVESAREAMGRVQGARLTVQPGLGHLAHEESPAEAAEIIIGFARETGVLARSSGDDPR